MVVQWYATHRVDWDKNPNTKKRNDWEDINKLYAGVDGATKSYFTQKALATYKKDKKGKKVLDLTTIEKNHPAYLVAQGFPFTIPSNAYINEIKFVANMKIGTTDYTAKQPMARFCMYGSNYSKRLDDNITKKTGWYDGLYCVYPNKNLTSTYTQVEYKMNASMIDKAGVTYEDINNDGRFGVDLIFEDATFQDKQTHNKGVWVSFVRCYIDYDVPEYNLVYDPNHHLDKDLIISGETFLLDAIISQTTNAYGGTQVLDVVIPDGVELVSATSSNNGFDINTRKWTIDANGKKSYGITLELRPKISKMNDIVIGNDSVGHYTYTFDVSSGIKDGDNKITITTLNETHQGNLTCKNVRVDGTTGSDRAIPIYVSDLNIIEEIQSITVNSTDNITSSANIIADDKIIGVNVVVPPYSKYSINLDVCYVPTNEGTGTFTVTTPTDTATVTETIKAPYVYHFGSGYTSDGDSTTRTARLNHDGMVISNHRVVSELETGAIVLPCRVKEHDSVMVQSPCRLNMNIWEDLDYIGCVPLEQTHFDPTSTYKDTLLDSHYKNKRYLGKKLASDETITLNVRLHPRDVTTIQGLIDMDKPIPINTNHKSFEGDSLNHRGWCEIYGIKATKTNPSWYKTEIDVKYLTHNLNSRFYINKGTKIANYTYNDILAESFGSGSPLTSGDNVNDYFITKTDGTYVYNTDIDGYDNERNQFSIDNGQYFNIRTQDTLSTTSQVAFQWKSTLLKEEKENNIARRISLLDENLNEIFYYEYYDIQLYDANNNRLNSPNSSTDDVDHVKCSVIGVLGDETVISNTIQLSLDVDVSDVQEDDIEVGEASQSLYGSILHFNIKDNVLEVVDEGVSGKELTASKINLTSGKYYWKTEFVNRNSDDESNDIECFVDLIINNTILNSAFADKYGKMYVSPFPVAKKRLLFSREAEEGTIYYYEDDREEFSFIIDPYYIYHNGTDLVTSDGISIFNLNYGYEVVYIQNGLVRLGFNRLNGHLYLGKYDSKLGDYITLQHLQLEKYDDINVNSITDDKIEIQASDSIFTIYRGHPYIVVNHELEDIKLSDSFVKVWAEAVDGEDAVEYPTYWDLYNNKNLLPPCVGGEKAIQTSCLTVSEKEISSRETSTLEWGNIKQGDTTVTVDEIYTDKDYKFYISGTVPSYSDELTSYEGNSVFGAYTITTECDATIPDKITIQSTPIIQSGDTVPIYGILSDVCGNGISGQQVDFYEVFTPVSTILANPQILQSGDTSTITLGLKDSSDGSTVSLKGADEVRLYELFTPSATIKASSDIIQSGSTSTITMGLKDTSDGSLVPLNGVDEVRLYEEYTPLLKLTGDKTVMQTSDNLTLTTGIYDSVDGSKVAESGKTVKYYSLLNNPTPSFISNHATYSYDSENEYYIINKSVNEGDPTYLDFGLFNDVNKFTFSADIYIQSKDEFTGGYNLFVGAVNSTNSPSKGILGGTNSSNKCIRKINSSSSSSDLELSSVLPSERKWYNYTVSCDGTYFSTVITDLSNDDVIYDKKVEYSLDYDPHFVVFVNYCISEQYVRNINIEVE